MKRLLILTVLAMMTLSTTSGCRMWNNWFHRGDACDGCVSSVSHYGSDDGMMMMEGSSGTTQVPGSRVIGPSTIRTIPGGSGSSTLPTPEPIYTPRQG